jgi:hypothetical protein
MKLQKNNKTSHSQKSKKINIKHLDVGDWIFVDWAENIPFYIWKIDYAASKAWVTTSSYLDDQVGHSIGFDSSESDVVYICKSVKNYWYYLLSWTGFVHAVKMQSPIKKQTNKISLWS